MVLTYWDKIDVMFRYMFRGKHFLIPMPNNGVLRNGIASVGETAEVVGSTPATPVNKNKKEKEE